MLKTSELPFLLTMADGGDGGGSGGDGGDGSGGNDGGDAGKQNDGGGNAGEGGNSGNYTPPASQADLDRIVSERLTRDRQTRGTEFDAMKAKLTEYEQRDMSDADKMTAKVTEATSEAATAKAEATQLRVALNHGFVTQDEKTGAYAVDADALELLGTGTEEELETRAKTIATLRSKQKEETAPFAHGPRGGSAAASMNDLLFGRKR